MNNITLVLFLVIASGTVFSQQPKTSEITYDTDYLLEEFRLPGGVAGNNVNCIVQGPHGFLWFGSHGGLHRYDGYEIITYEPVESDTIGETTSLTFPYIENLYWDRFNKLWVTTFGGGLFRFDPETEIFKHFKADPNDPDALPHLQVLCATEDANGELWFGTGKGLCHFDRKTEKFTSYFADPADAKSLRHDRIGSIYVDKQGTLWIGTGQALFIPEPGGISRFHPETNSFSNFGYKRSPDDKSFLGAVTPMLEDSRGNFWVGTTDALFKMDRQAGTFEKMPFDLGKAAVYSIYEDRAGGLWVGTVGAASHPFHLLRYDPETRSTQHFPIKTHVWQVIESADGTVWAAGAGVGGKVWKLSQKALEFDLQRGWIIKATFPSSKLIKDLKVNAAYHFSGPFDMTIDPATGIFWVQYMLAFYDTVVTPPVLPVLASYDPNSGNCEFYPLHGLCDKVMDNTRPGNLWNAAGMAVDKYGKIWGTFKHEQIGIYSFDPNNGAIQHFTHNPNDPISLTSNDLISLMMDSRGEIWAGTYQAGLNRLNPVTGKITHYHFYDKDSIWHDDSPVALIEHPDGKIWVGGQLTAGAQAFVSIIDPVTDSIREFPLTEMFANASITSMVLQPQQGWLTLGLWQKGVCLYDFENQRFNPLNTKNGNFPFDDVASILYDRNGDLWAASADAGNFVFWPILEGTSSTKYLFKNKSGLGSLHRRAIIGPNNGHLYFLNEEGWAEIDPENLNVESPADSTITTLVDLYVQGEKQAPGKGDILSKPLWMLDEITLPNDAETFGFRFTDFNFRHGAPKYKYRLYPYETVWRETTQEPVANYYKIPHGKYQFQVRVIEENGQLGEQQTELIVTILPPWYRTWWAYIVYVIIGSILIFGFIRWRTMSLQKEKVVLEEKVQERTSELKEKSDELHQSIENLKSTQAQLIQSEKMASLGELTAGIAHEIQNPLNFVNNFSEVSSELVDETLEQVEAVKTRHALSQQQDSSQDKESLTEIKGLLGDVKSNLEKINHHGQRASSIVKGMLEHSRVSTGEKVPTNINALADEYLRLAYHGLRAKDKSFNADFITNLDPTLPKINVIPQDIGRVLLNVINNAFYAVQLETQNSATLQQTPQKQPDYKPMVMVSTKNMETHVEIRVKDNGPGIPDAIKDKIFQPFFTTKPTGQGTGLGLSLSYDIVKAHGGELKVESEEGTGTEFSIKLPIV